jgi:hypothetical protein
MTATEKMTLDKVEESLHNWSPQGCTATTREAAKLFKPLSDLDLAMLHTRFCEHYAHWHQYAESDLGEEIGSDDNGDVVMAVEEMHDALKARWLISYELTSRQKKAAKKAPKKKAA